LTQFRAQRGVRLLLLLREKSLAHAIAHVLEACHAARRMRFELHEMHTERRAHRTGPGGRLRGGHCLGEHGAEVARNVIAPAELSVGVITSICGAPFFVYLLRTRYRAHL